MGVCVVLAVSHYTHTTLCVSDEVGAFFISQDRLIKCFLKTLH